MLYSFIAVRVEKYSFLYDLEKDSIRTREKKIAVRLIIFKNLRSSFCVKIQEVLSRADAGYDAI